MFTLFFPQMTIRPYPLTYEPKINRRIAVTKSNQHITYERFVMKISQENERKHFNSS